ncbi:uncharacterized protein [Amphiura filiformis]|uniref:uncharacterized protein n=1 Tax=Amphiura filiformis TaxID=82378 RepID=UPI003B21F94A
MVFFHASDRITARVALTDTWQDQNQRVEEEEELRSYDVSALFTSVPVDKALRIVRSRLEQDSALGDRTELTPDQIVRLCETCLKQYFIYNGDYYEQLHGAAMGLPLSPILCNIYMEDLEQRDIATAPHPPLWWFRYVDDTHCKLKKCHSQEFTDHLNSLDKDIKFTTEGEENDSLAFLDTLTVIQPDRSIKVTIYRKSTHTDQYLNFSSIHPIDHKLRVIRTLYHRADTVVTNLQDREDEKAHVNNALVKCGYPKWALDKATDPKTHKTSDVGDKRPNKGHVVLPYTKGTSEAIRRTFSNYGVSVFFKPTHTLGQILVSPKDKTDKKDITGPARQIRLQPGDILVSFDVVSSFTNVPIDDTWEITGDALQRDPSFDQRTRLFWNEVVDLTKLYLTSTYFKWEGKFYEQK